jgi:hypothetical protein
MSNEIKQTSIEWLLEQLKIIAKEHLRKKYTFTEYCIKREKAIEQAKEMHSKELELAYEDGKEIRHILNTIEKNQF